jgi:Mrp family chromosome partitioning ATPase
MARWSGRLAGAAEASPTMQRFGKAATELVRLREHGMSFSVGVTATDEGNGHPYAAIGLAMTWARWGHRTLLVCTGGRFNEFGHEFNCTTPSIADLFEALAEGRRLPVPPMLMPVITNLEVLSGMGHLTLSRLVETNWLSLFAEAVRSRYDRIIWSLPPMSEGTWTPAMLHQVVDALTLSIRPGRTTLLSVRRLADEVQRAELPPLQVIWQD